MSCFYCKGDVVSDITTYMTNYNDCYIIIKNVPCNKCTQCGEEYISGDVLLKIEGIIKNVKSLLTEIAVIDYTEAA
ncbi:MAG: type II toxin-antitoxin system MqsA family antitoxin [Lachnospiraceae bacterium]|nr:type II toxin-antitoxin system MqsA family antitoxin [Lachnospiraceae bacterium]